MKLGRLYCYSRGDIIDSAPPKKTPHSADILITIVIKIIIIIINLIAQLFQQVQTLDHTSRLIQIETHIKSLNSYVYKA